MKLSDALDQAERFNTPVSRPGRAQPVLPEQARGEGPPVSFDLDDINSTDWALQASTLDFLQAIEAVNLGSIVVKNDQILTSLRITANGIVQYNGAITLEDVRATNWIVLQTPVEEG